MSSTKSTYRATVAAVALLLSAPVVLAKPMQGPAQGKNAIKTLEELKNDCFKKLCKKAMSGDPEAQFRFALFLLEGDGLIKNGDIAGRLFLRSAQQGDGSAIEWILNYFPAGKGKQKFWLSKEVNTELKAFSRGHHVATAQPKPATQAAKQLKTDLDDLYQEARNGNADAQFQLAKILKEKNGFITNPDVIIRWFLTAAQQGHQEAITFILGFSMDRSQHVSKTLQAEVDAFVAGFRMGRKEKPMK